MLAKIFLSLTEYAWFRRTVWKPIYNHLAKKFPYENWVFMNYGFDPEDERQRPTLLSQEEAERYPAQLYHFLATQTDIEGKLVLEVGSGRGGGASYIARYLKPVQITGMDIASNAVVFANQRHVSPNLRYIEGNAEKIPFPDASFDVVINVESSHAYGSVEKFFTEVYRVLKPGGTFLITDMRDRNNMGRFKEQLLASGLALKSERIINANIAKAIEAEDELKRARIREAVPTRYVKFFEEFGGVKGSQIHMDIASGKLVYFWFIIQRPPA